MTEPSNVPQHHVQVEEDLFPKDDESVYFLRTQSRQMRLTFNLDSDKITANTYLSSIPGKEKQPGETTALYMKANEIMQRVANKTGNHIYYTFGTRQPKLALWAAQVGEKIFHWTRIDPLTEEIKTSEQPLNPDEPFIAERIYGPES